MEQTASTFSWKEGEDILHMWHFLDPQRFLPSRPTADKFAKATVEEPTRLDGYEGIGQPIFESTEQGMTKMDQRDDLSTFNSSVNAGDPKVLLAHILVAIRRWYTSAECKSIHPEFLSLPKWLVRQRKLRRFQEKLLLLSLLHGNLRRHSLTAQRKNREETFPQYDALQKVALLDRLNNAIPPANPLGGESVFDADLISTLWRSCEYCLCRTVYLTPFQWISASECRSSTCIHSTHRVCVFLQ